MKRPATCTRLGGKQLVRRSIRVSAVVLLLPSLCTSSSSVLARPGLAHRASMEERVGAR
jgi:hypothetical protein